MADENAEVRAESGKLVTITIAEKSGAENVTSSSTITGGTAAPNTFVIDNGFQILTITIAE